MTDSQTRRRWTPQDDARLAELRGQGLSDTRIAHDLSRTRAAVKRRAHTLRARPGAPAIAPRPQPAATTPYDAVARATVEVEQAHVALAEARARKRKAMEVILGPVREALDAIGVVVLPDPDGDDDGPEHEAAWRLVETLRRRGVELRRVS